MEPISAAHIQKTIKAGRIVEARTLLTLKGSALSEDEQRSLDLELTRLHNEASALIAEAEAMENEGRDEAAKALYKSVGLFAADFPGIQDHIRRMEESLFLTKAVKRRSQRIRGELTPRVQPPPLTKKFISLSAAGLTAILVAVLLSLSFLRHQPPKTIPPAATHDAPERIASVSPASPPETIPSPAPAESSGEVALATEQTPLPEVKEEPLVPQVPPAPPIEAKDIAPLRATPPPQEEPTQPPATLLYTVLPGDSLSLIAQRQFCNRDAWKEMYRRNREQIEDPNKLRPGMKLHLEGIMNLCPPVP